MGGDITAGALITMLWNTPELSMLIDLGTNGELVLGNQDFLIACACSAVARNSSCRSLMVASRFVAGTSRIRLIGAPPCPGRQVGGGLAPLLMHSPFIGAIQSRFQSLPASRLKSRTRQAHHVSLPLKPTLRVGQLVDCYNAC